MKHLTVAIPYCLAGGFFILIGVAKLSHVAYTQALICLTVGVVLELVGLKLLQLWGHRSS